MRQAGIGWVIAGMISLLLWALLFFGATRAHAERYCAHWYGVKVFDGWSHHIERRCARWVHRYDETRVYGYERRWNDDEDSRSGRQCKEVRRAVGDQHLTTDGAKKAANDAWAALIRFHYGEKWIDLNNARHIVYTCSRSSIKEAGASVTTLGQALNRCEVVAQPCAPLPESEQRNE